MAKRVYEAGELVVLEFRGQMRCDWSYIPPGTFLQGSPDSDDEALPEERPQREMTLTQGFLMQRTPVTQEQWQAVMHTTPSGFKGPRRPVEQVTLLDAVTYCNTLSQLAGLPEAYLISPIHKNVRRRKNPRGYRLPMEAEWEYACRAGTTTPRYGEVDDIAWHEDNSDGQTQDVGLKAPNAWNLYDMLGNVWEWTDDRDMDYRNEYSDRVIRGGGWFNDAGAARAGSRLYHHPDGGISDLGFRPVRSLLRGSKSP